MYETTLETLKIIAQLGVLVPFFAAFCAVLFDTESSWVLFLAAGEVSDAEIRAALKAAHDLNVRIVPAKLECLAPTVAAPNVAKRTRRTSCNDDSCEGECRGLFYNEETKRIERCDQCELHDNDKAALNHAKKCALCHLTVKSQGYRSRSPRKPKAKLAKVSVRVLNAGDAQTLSLCVAQAFSFKAMRDARAHGAS